MTKRGLSVLACFLVAAGGRMQSRAADEPPTHDDSVTRQATFKLTFANHDLVWFGDPASPTATVYPKPGARPIATDCYVTTLTERWRSPSRRYLHESRIVTDGELPVVYAFTKVKELAIGTIDDQGRFVPNEHYGNHEMLPSWPAYASLLRYDRQRNALYTEIDLPGPELTETLDFLPWNLVDAAGKPVQGQYTISYTPTPAGAPRSAPAGNVTLRLQTAVETLTLARARVPRVFRREDAVVGSFDNPSGTYVPEPAYRAGGNLRQYALPSVTFSVVGKFASSIRDDGPTLALAETQPAAETPADRVATGAASRITIDGNFDDWRNIAGVSDPRGDVVPYLEYVPDVDLLEFKLAHDDRHIYMYARVAGQVGRSINDRGVSYFYAYMDVDQNPKTGFIPSRDDDCYFGVDIGDDCEVQFEFVNSAFRKTFYGFCGLGGDENALKQQLRLGPSQYGRRDDEGNERANYKTEYIYRQGVTEITEDLKQGSSDSIRLAVSPDGSEVEIASTFEGFLKDDQGRPTLQLGQTIDVAVGMECDGKQHQSKRRWAADSTPVIRGYHLSPASPAAE